MTNGEKIKELFPHFDVEDKTEYFGRLRNLDDHFIKADIDFWNSEYEEPSTPNDCETCIHNKGVLECDMYGCKYEPTTKNNLGVDCVDRRELLKIYEGRFLELQKLKHLKDNKGAEDRQLGLNYCINILKEMPSVTPQEPKTGHWIGQKKIGFGEWKEFIVPLKDGYVTDSCSCSECGEWLTGSDEYQCYGNFCPNCGADMREVEE